MHVMWCVGSKENICNVEESLELFVTCLLSAISGKYLADILALLRRFLLFVITLAFPVT